ncbi:MAG: DUF3833 domain-containing protein [Enterovibrio sp.]
MKWLLMLLAMLSGCSLKIDGEQYRDQQPKLDLLTFFNGEVKAWGIVQNRSGNVVSRFTVDIKGRYQDGVLTLDETFVYGLGDGVKHRVWSIKPSADGRFTGSASDIAGPAIGESHGNALSWSYHMDLPVDGSSYNVKFEDWMWAFDANTLMNRSYIRKFGITFAQVTIFMQRQPL